MKRQYLTPTVDVILMTVERSICAASTVISGGDYDLYQDKFDSDSD